MQISRSLQRSYSLLAPLYDSVVDWPTRAARQRSLMQLPSIAGQQWLIAGVGSGLDLPYLPADAQYVAVDITYAMLQRARRRLAPHLNCALHQADVMQLPYADAHFDGVIMHLILAVVPEPQRALDEASRVLKPGGRLLILDKFLKPNQFAPVRRTLSPLISRLATRTDVEFEQLQLGELTLLSNQPALLNGWFRQIQAGKN